MQPQRNCLACGFGVAFVTLAIVFLCKEADGSCLDTRMCCPGRNNTCFSYGPKDNPNERREKDERCFCDQACSTMLDCCQDYRQACKPTDCEVGGYSAWSKCDNPCGVGAQKRRRKIRVFPENGGTGCPVLKQRRGCIGDDYGDCLQQDVNHRARELREISRILPASYGKYRREEKYYPQRDPLRKNLFVGTGYDVNEILPRAAYCAQFEVVDRTRDCNKTDNWAAALKPGETVCVECQPLAMFKRLGMRCKGHGVFEEVTSWNAIGVHGCRGHWRMTTKRDSCQCVRRGKTDFILL